VTGVQTCVFRSKKFKQKHKYWLNKNDENCDVFNKELLEKITLVDPDSFNKGRAILKDGYTSEKILLQIPFIRFKD
jgi:hypothetical protein